MMPTVVCEGGKRMYWNRPNRELGTRLVSFRVSMQIVPIADHPVMQVKDKYFGIREKAGWFSRFEPVMQDAGGFTEVHHLDVPVRPHLLQVESDLSVAVVTELFEMLLNKEKLEGEAYHKKTRSRLAANHWRGLIRLGIEQ